MIKHLIVSIWALGLFVAAIRRSDSGGWRSEVAVQLADSIDTESGLALDVNLPLVKAQCTGCHSPKLIVQHRFTRDEWLSKIRWMQRNHKLWDLGETEKTVLDYLTKHYSPSPTAYSRRQALRNIKWYRLE